MPIGNEDMTEAATKHGRELDAQIITKAAVETATDKSYRVSWRYNTGHINPSISATDYSLHSWGAVMHKFTTVV